MTAYEINIIQNIAVQSLLIDAISNCTINNILYDNNDEQNLPLNEVAYPIEISLGKKLILFNKPVVASKFIITGNRLEAIRGVSVNDSSLVNVDSLRSMVDDIVADKISYVHIQQTPNALWVMIHNLGYYPNVSVVDSAGSVVYGDVAHVNENQLSISFVAAFSGKAFLS